MDETGRRRAKRARCVTEIPDGSFAIAHILPPPSLVDFLIRWGVQDSLGTCNFRFSSNAG